MTAYIPEVGNIDPGVIFSWVVDLEAELSRHAAQVELGKIFVSNIQYIGMKEIAEWKCK